MGDITEKTLENYKMPDFTYAVCERRGREENVIRFSPESVDLNECVGIEFYKADGEFIRKDFIERSYNVEPNPIVEIWWYGTDKDA